MLVKINSKVVLKSFKILKISFHLEYRDTEKNNKNAVHIVLCIVSSIGLTKETDLKYKTPITPHQSEPSPLEKIPLKVFLFINY
jgi:hypothetical protein